MKSSILLTTTTLGFALALGVVASTSQANAADTPTTKPTTGPTAGPTTKPKTTPTTTEPTLPKMPAVCGVQAFSRVPDRERQTDCDYLFRNVIPSGCGQFVVFYSLRKDETFHAYGVCRKPEAVHFHLTGRWRATPTAAADLNAATGEISTAALMLSLANSGFSFGSESGLGHFSGGGGPGPSGPGGDDSYGLLIEAAHAHFEGQEVASKYLIDF